MTPSPRPTSVVFLLVGVLVLVGLWFGLGWEANSAPHTEAQASLAVDDLASKSPPAQDLHLGEPGELETRRLVSGEAKEVVPEGSRDGGPRGEALDPGDLLKAIRAAEATLEPHVVAWPAVQELGSLVASSRDEGNGVQEDLEVIARGPETEFVRGAVLLALGLGLPKNEARRIAEPFIEGPPGEVARAAWLVLALARGMESGGAGSLDLAGFDTIASRVNREIWPVTLPAVSAESASEAIELAVAYLSPARAVLDAPVNPERPEGWREEGVLTREVILLSTLAVPGQAPGPARDWLMKWISDSDMERACLWSLCMAARTDDALANELRSLLLTMDLFSLQGRAVAQMLGGVADRGDLVLGMLLTELNTNDAGDPRLDLAQNVDALIAIGEMLDSSNEVLGKQALDALVDLAIDPERSEDLRMLTLAQLSVARPEKVGDAIELILISQDTSSAREWAANFATSVPVDQQERMRDLLIQSFDFGTDASKLESLKSLAYLGGPKVEDFFASLAGEDGLSDESKAVMAQFQEEQ